jgi:transposase-like protein
VREGVRYVSKALFILAGVRSNGYCEIFTFSIADAEHELILEGFFSYLKESGLNKIDLIISDNHNDIQTTAETMFPGSLW